MDIGVICHKILTGKTTSKRISELLDRGVPSVDQWFLNYFRELLGNSEKLPLNFSDPPHFPKEEEAIKKVKDEDVQILREVRYSSAEAFVSYDEGLVNDIRSSSNLHDFQFAVFLLPSDESDFFQYLQSASGG